MSGCEAYQIKLLEKFNSSFETLIKAHYRKNKRGRASFEKLIEDFIGFLRQNPASNDVLGNRF